MSCACQSPFKDEQNNQAKPDRYISFIGLDCDLKAAGLMALIRRYIDDPQHSNAFWEYFKKKAAGDSGPRQDDLFLIHSNLNQIRELFEQKQDQEALSLLDIIEEECC